MVSFKGISPVHILVIGDFMLDSYTVGKVERVSPEAPVAILKVEKQTFQPGGAGNVALNFASLGAKVKVLGRIGEDEQGKKLLVSLSKIDTDYLLDQKGYITPIKNRLLADSQQLLRIDTEKKIPLSDKLKDKIKKNIDSILEKTDMVCISDYDKGFLSTDILQFILKSCREKNIPVLVDPKGLDFTKYQGATLIKPNEKEAYLAANIPFSASIDEVGKKLLSITSAKDIVITRSSKGIAHFADTGVRKDFTIESKEVVDVTGAGDTVLAMLGVSLVNGYSLDESLVLSNIAAGITVEKIGCVHITLPELATRLLKIDSGNKIFDKDHLYALEKVLEEDLFNILELDSKDINGTIIETILELSDKKDHRLIIVTKTDTPSIATLKVLSSLKEVDYILLGKDCLNLLKKHLNPQNIFHLEKIC